MEDKLFLVLKEALKDVEHLYAHEIINNKNNGKLKAMRTNIRNLKFLILKETLRANDIII